jgi:uncharacterized membrane protein YagU involved in acid resistance
MTNPHQTEKAGAQIMRPTPRMAASVRTGWLVFLTLMVLAIVEYIIFLVLSSNFPLMVVINLADAALIIYFYMHVTRLWRREEKH